MKRLETLEGLEHLKTLINLASWMIKSRKGNLSRIISSLNQQVVFNRGKNPSYARKMKTTMNIVRKRLGKKKDE